VKRAQRLFLFPFANISQNENSIHVSQNDTLGSFCGRHENFFSRKFTGCSSHHGFSSKVPARHSADGRTTNLAQTVSDLLPQSQAPAETPAGDQNTVSRISAASIGTGI